MEIQCITKYENQGVLEVVWNFKYSVLMSVLFKTGLFTYSKGNCSNRFLQDTQGSGNNNNNQLHEW